MRAAVVVPFGYFRAAALILFLGGCGGESSRVQAREQALEGDGVVDFGVHFQKITGFGASSAWTAPDLSESMADEFFSARDGIGLSLLRVRISPSGRTGERATAIKALSRGASVWASPWSPPGAWKDNNSDINGGSLLPEYRTAWAERLAAFALEMSESGLPLLVLSAQNEPNWTAEWETCRWTEAELSDFIRDELGPALSRAGVETPILAPETINWDSLQSYGNRLLEDPEARKYLGALATHSYGGSVFNYRAPSENGLELWQTEVSDEGEEGPDPGMDSGLRVAKMIHDHLAFGQVSAWHYWWLLSRGDRPADNGSLTHEGALTRRAYALGNWSKFVRPGFVRVQASESPRDGVWITAFRDLQTPRFAIVVINETDVEVTQRFSMTGSEATEVLPWVTSDEQALLEQPAVEAEPDGFAYPLLPRSVTTFTGMLDGSEPAPFTESESGVGGSAGMAPAPMPVAGRSGSAGRPLAEPPAGGGTACICAVPGAPGRADRTVTAWFVAFPAWLAFAACRRHRTLRNRAAARRPPSSFLLG